MIEAKIVKTHIVKDAVFSKILNDKKLRDILIFTTGLRDSSFARRKSQTKVTNIDTITAIKDYTKWTDDDIFEADK